MRIKLFIVLLILLFAINAQAGGVSACAGSGVAVASCTTLDNGDTLDDALATDEGGDTASWATTGAAGSCATCAEHTTLSGTPPTASCTKGWSADCTYATPTNNICMQWYTTGTIDPDATSVDILTNIYVGSDTSIAAYGSKYIVMVASTAAVATVKNEIRITNNTASRAAPNQIKCYPQSGTASTAVTISTNTWYTVKMHLDATAADSYCQVTGGSSTTCDGVAECKFTRNADDYGYLGIVAVPSTADDRVKVEVGYISIDKP